MNTALPVRLLQAVAAITGVALVLWSLGLTSIQTVNAEQVTNVSDVLTDSDLGVVSNHTLTFTINNAVESGETIDIDFDDNFDLSAITPDDVDVSDDGGDVTLAATPSGATWGVSVQAGEILRLTNGTTAVATGSVMVVEIGTNATNQTTGTNQITNPGVANSYAITFGGTSGTTGETRVAIVDDVVVTASVDTRFNFNVAGVAGGQAVNGTTTTGASTATAIPFGTLTANAPSTTAQDLTVTTNAANGFVVTVQYSGDLTSSNSDTINAFRDGVSSTTPQAWAAPAATIGSVDTYGHWGFTSTDADLVGQGTNFGANQWVGPSTTPIAVFAHDDVADGSTAGVGSARVGYQIEISSLQEAGNDYNTTLTYIATPTF